MPEPVWVLGASGRTGSAVAHLLAARNMATVLVGRNASRLEALAEEVGARTVIAAGLDDMAAAIRRDRPGVVLNTVGPFSATAPTIIDACIAAGSHYVDLGNDMASVPAVLDRNMDAAAAGVTLVTGAGFGAAATECVAVRVCAGMPPAARVRTDMVPSLAIEEGTLGEAFAATLLHGMPGVPGGRYQARRVARGRVVSAGIGSRPRALTTPDGDTVRTGLMPLGELEAARRASGSPEVEAASSEAPSGPVRALFPLAEVALRIGPLRRALIHRLAAVHTSFRPRPREYSWAHARVEWANGQIKEGWLRLGDASDATARFAAEVTARLAEGGGEPGAFTPAALFGPGLAEASGGHYVE